LERAGRSSFCQTRIVLFASLTPWLQRQYDPRKRRAVSELHDDTNWKCCMLIIFPPSFQISCHQFRNSLW
jgi:hypothetical protein